MKKAVILAGGLGTRLKPFSEVIPKPLLPLGERAVTEIQLEQLREAGFTDVYLATNYMSNFIESFLGNGEKYGVRLHFSRETRPLGTAGPLSLLRDQLDEPFLVMNGDILTKLDLRRFATIAVNRPSKMVVATKIITTPFRFGNVTVDEHDRIVDVEEKPEFKLEVIAGIYGMKPGALELVPDNTFFGMDQLIRTLIDRGDDISRYLTHDYWLDIGQVEDYSQARDEYEQHFKVA